MCKLNAKKLVEYRNKANMTRSELARKTDVSPSSICKYEKGVLNSSDEVLERIANALGVDKRELDLDTERVATAVMEGDLCCTGLIESCILALKESAEKTERMGGKVSDSVTSKTSFLINNDSKSTSGKNKKAHELNIPIITEEQFLEMIGGN